MTPGLSRLRFLEETLHRKARPIVLRGGGPRCRGKKMRNSRTLYKRESGGFIYSPASVRARPSIFPTAFLRSRVSIAGRKDAQNIFMRSPERLSAFLAGVRAPMTAIMS